MAETWGADAKDQESARLLGKAFSWPGSLAVRPAVPGAARAPGRAAGYVGDLTAELDGRVGGIEVVAEKRLLSMVTAAARRLAR